MKKFLRVLWISFKVLVLLAVVFTASLFFREQQIPSFLVDAIAGRVSSREFLVRCDTASFGFRRGLRLCGVRVYDLRRQDSLEQPVALARMIKVDFLRRDVHVDGAIYRRLPDSYYEDTGEIPPPSPVEFDIPELDPLTVTLEGPSILGVCPERATAKLICRRRSILLEDVSVLLPDKDCSTRLRGEFSMNLDQQKIRTDVSGEVKQTQVRPFVETMDIPSALPYIDAFTDLAEPVPARLVLEADLVTKDIDLRIDLKPRSGRYNGVPIDVADGTVSFESRHAGTNRTYAVKVDLPYAADGDGRTLRGDLCVDNTSGPYRLGFGVVSELAFPDAVSVVGLVSPDDLKALRCDTPPRVAVKGKCCTEPEDWAANDLAGTFSLRSGTLSGFRMRDADATFSLKGDVLDAQLRATGKTGGLLDLGCKVAFGGFADGAARFDAKAKYRGGSLEELADVLSMDLGDRNGVVDWDFEVSGPANEGATAGLNGKGTLKISDGHLAQMKLFAGLTELLAEKIPGVSFLVNQTQASADYTITNGVFESDNIYIEGGLISIKGWGRYDIPKDNLDFTARVQFLKNESLMGKIIHPVTFPFTKLLLEYKVDGPVDDPKWRYIKILDRIF